MTIHSHGLRTWLWQRLTSVYIGLYLFIAVIWFLTTDDLTYARWLSVMAHPVINVATALFILALLIHVGVGLRDILVDYVHPLAVRFTIMVLLVTILIALAIWAMMILTSVVAL